MNEFVDRRGFALRVMKFEYFDPRRDRGLVSRVKCLSELPRRGVTRPLPDVISFVESLAKKKKKKKKLDTSLRVTPSGSPCVRAPRETFDAALTGRTITANYSSCSPERELCRSIVPTKLQCNRNIVKCRL